MPARLLHLFSLLFCEKIYMQARKEEVFQMAAYFERKEADIIEELAADAERLIEEDDLRKDLKEKREFMKQTYYDGSHKLKHLIPKGKRL